jgi:hypothetical protein
MQSYTEICVSGRGLHILVKAELSDRIGRKHGAVEIYDAQRYFALTGERLVADPPPYRPSPLLRGPEHLLIDVEEVRAGGKPLAHPAQR